IGRITTAGVLTEFPVPGGGAPEAIATGPDGALWFTEFSTNQIGRITTAGAITEFTVPGAGGLYGIVSGPDGALWFTQSGANQVGRITPAGLVTEFLIPTTDSEPWGITAGSDGALWFTEYHGQKIGKVTPPAPTPGAFLYTLTPCRILDTRNPEGPFGGPALANNTARLSTLAARSG